jgi:hypothetical protein
MIWRAGHVQAVERIADASEADARVLEHLAHLGCDPSRPRECRHYLYVPGEHGAWTLAQTLSREGWDTDVEEAAECWLVTATTHTVLTGASVRATRSRLEHLVWDHGGAYDGWEAAAD